MVKACEETKAIIYGSVKSVSYHVYNASGNTLKIQGAFLFLRIGCMTNLRRSLWSMQELGGVNS